MLPFVERAQKGQGGVFAWVLLPATECVRQQRHIVLAPIIKQNGKGSRSRREIIGARLIEPGPQRRAGCADTGFRALPEPLLKAECELLANLIPVRRHEGEMNRWSGVAGTTKKQSQE